MSLVESIYHRMPIPMQCLMVNAWGALWCWRRYGRHYREKLQELLSHEKWTAEQFAQWQLRALNEQLQMRSVRLTIVSCSVPIRFLHGYPRSRNYRSCPF